MKAVILAGGQGTRLKCITGDTPKPLVPFLGQPLLGHILALLRKNGFTELCAAVKYRAQDVIDRFGSGEDYGVSLCYRPEDEPRGTAGAVKNCADFYGGEDFLVISGDAACDFDLRSLMAVHREKNAAVTLALYRHSEPLSLGLAVTDGEGLIRSFIEKPDWPHVVTDLVNTGIYVISPRVMELVPGQGAFDFARDLFPLLLEKGERLVGVPMEGYWCDVGTPLAYYRCCADALEGRLNVAVPESFRAAVPPEASDDEDGSTAHAELVCSDRARLMGTLGEALMDMGVRYDRGIVLTAPGYELRIAPLSRASALRISVWSPDAEFARSLCLSAEELARALDAPETGR